jgi:hypothetical protein
MNSQIFSFLSYKSKEWELLSFVNNFKIKDIVTLFISGEKEKVGLMRISSSNCYSIILFVIFLLLTNFHRKSNEIQHYINSTLYICKTSSLAISETIKHYFKNIFQRDKEGVKIVNQTNKDFLSKLNFLNKLRQFLKKGMILQVFEDIKPLTKFQDYNNLVFYVLLFVFDFFSMKKKCVCYFKKDTKSILNRLLKIEITPEEIRILKGKSQIYKTNTSKNQIAIPKEFFNLANIELIVGLVFQLLFNSELNQISLSFLEENKSANSFCLLMLVHQILLKAKIPSEHQHRLINSCQIESILKSNGFVDKLNSHIKKIVINTLKEKDIYKDALFFIKMIRFNFTIERFRDIVSEKILENFHKILSIKLIQFLKNIFLKQKGSSHYNILEEFIKIKEFKCLFNCEQIINILFKFRPIEKKVTDENILLFNDVLLIFKAYFTFATFLLNKLKKSKQIICNEVFNREVVPTNKNSIGKYKELIVLIKKMNFLFYIFHSVMNCLLIHITSSKSVQVGKFNGDLEVEYLIHFIKLGFYLHVNNKDSDFFEFDLILNSVLSLFNREKYDERLLLAFYIYCPNNEQIDSRKVSLESILGSVRKVNNC